MSFYKPYAPGNWASLSAQAVNYYNEFHSGQENLFIKANRRQFLTRIPEFATYFKQNGLICVDVFFQVMNKDTVQYLRQDTGRIGNTRLLWPVQNCENTITRFFDVSNCETITVDNQGIYYNNTNAQEISSYKLIQPMIVNCKTPYTFEVDPELVGNRINLYFKFSQDTLDKLL